MPTLLLGLLLTLQGGAALGGVTWGCSVTSRTGRGAPLSLFSSAQGLGAGKHGLPVHPGSPSLPVHPRQEAAPGHLGR